MSEQENQPPTPPRPTVKTSAVPLKKETVRITLRPQGPGGDAAPPPPPPVAATAPIPPAPTAPAPPAPRPVSPTVPLAPPPRPTMPGAPPAPVAARPAPPSAPIGAKTIPLSQPPTRPASPSASPRPTGKIAGGTPTTQPLPRATVKLQPTTTPSAAISSVNVRTTALDDDDELDEGPLNVMGWVALVGAIAAIIGVLACWDKVEFFSEGEMTHGPSKESRDEAIASWKKSTAPDGFKLPVDFSPFDSKDGEGGITSNFKNPPVPAKPNAP